MSVPIFLSKPRPSRSPKTKRPTATDGRPPSAPEAPVVTAATAVPPAVDVIDGRRAQPSAVALTEPMLAPTASVETELHKWLTEESDELEQSETSGRPSSNGVDLRQPARRQALPQTLTLARLLRNRSRADLLHLRSALRAHPAVADHCSWSTAEAAFFRFVDATGSTACGEYDLWRRAQVDYEEIPSSKAVRDALGKGDWEVVKQLVGLKPGFDPTVRRLSALGGFFEREELEPVLRAWAERTHGVLSQDDFLSDCAERHAARCTDFPRYPLSLKPLHRVFTDWLGALDAIGERHRAARLAPRRAPRTEATDAVVLRSKCERDGVMLRFACQQLDVDFATGEWLTSKAFDVWAQAVRGRMVSEGFRPQVPSAGEIRERHANSWPQAIVDAGLVTAERAALRGRGKPKIDEDQYFRDLADSIAEKGPLVSPDAHQARRAKAMTEAAARGEKLQVAAEGTLRLRLGDGQWPRARSRTIEWMRRTGYKLAELDCRLEEMS